MFSRRESKQTESNPKSEPLPRRGSSDSMDAQVGSNDDRKQGTKNERRDDRNREDERKDYSQSLNIPYTIHCDGVNPPRIVFVSPSGSDRSSGRSRASSVRTPEHGDHRGPRSSKLWKEDLEDAIRFALSQIEIRPSTNQYEDGYENDYREYDDSKPSSEEYRPSSGRATQPRDHGSAASREPDRPEPSASYYYRRQGPHSASEETLHGFRMDYSEYTDASVQTDAPAHERRDTGSARAPNRRQSQRKSHAASSRPSVSRVFSAGYYVVDEDTKARVADEPRSKGSRNSYVFYQPPYRVLVTPHDENEPHKVSSNYNAYVRREDAQDGRREHHAERERESQGRRRNSRSRHSRSEHTYDHGRKERHEDRDRDNSRERHRSSHREGDATGRWYFPFVKDRRDEHH